MNQINFWIDIFQAIIILYLSFYVIFLHRKFKAAEKLIKIETWRRKKHAKAFEALTNPEKIEQEMERGAQLSEMRAAGRRTLPRENAGPHARVWRPNLRNQPPRYGRTDPRI